jgi:hypothetical protein
MRRGDESAPQEPQPTIEIDLGKAIALLALDNRLKAELATFARGSSETELIRGVRQPGAMIQYQSDPDVIALNAHQPVLKLYQALYDLCGGGRPPLLFEAKRPPDVKTKQKISPAHYRRASSRSVMPRWSNEGDTSLPERLSGSIKRCRTAAYGHAARMSKAGATNATRQRASRPQG